MSNYCVADPIVGAPMPVSQTGTFATSAGVFPPLAFGMQVRAVDRATGSANLGAAVFQFVCGSSTASAVSSAGQFVMLRNNTAQLLLSAQSTVVGVPIGLAAGAISNTNVWGWVQVAGIADYGRASASDYAEAAYAVKYIGDAGAIVSGATMGRKVLGLVNPVSNASGTSVSDKFTYQLFYPSHIGSMSATNAGGY